MTEKGRGLPAGDRRQIQEIPRALRMTLEKARSEYGALVRKVRWGEGPVYVCGAGECAGLGTAAGYAFETFLGWPVVARPVEVFRSYALSLLRPHSVLIMISASGEWPEARDLAHTARERGCTVIVLANTADSSLVKLAEHVLLASAEGDAHTPAVIVCLHTAINFLALEAARVLKRPEPKWKLMVEELNQLPDTLDWVFTQLPPVMRSVAGEVAIFPRLRFVGGGFYHFPAWQAARRIECLTGNRAEAVEASEYWSAHAHGVQHDEAALFLSGSNSKIKKLLHRCALQARQQGTRVLSITDSNDRELVEASDVGILIPSLLEAPACTLATFVLEWLAIEARHAVNQPSTSK